MDDCSRTVKTKTFEEWKLEHEHGEINEITGLTDPPYMIKRMCSSCGAKHVGLREGTYL